MVRDPADLAADGHHRNPSLGGDEVERLPLALDLNELDEHAYPADRPLVSLQSRRCEPVGADHGGDHLRYIARSSALSTVAEAHNFGPHLRGNQRLKPREKGGKRW